KQAVRGERVNCMHPCVLSVLLLNVFCSFVSSLYFHIGETEKKCFIEEIPDETMIIGNYRTQLYDKQAEEYLPATQGLGMFVEVKDPDDKVILSRQYGSEGRFTFTSHTPGEHQICLHSNSSKFSLFAGGMLRVHLDIQVGEHANNYAEIAAKDKLTELQLRVRQLVEQVDQIQKEQNYQRYREERFRQTSESTNQRVLWWSIVQTLILVAIGIWQMRHLKSFFECKWCRSRAARRTTLTTLVTTESSFFNHRYQRFDCSASNVRTFLFKFYFIILNAVYVDLVI
uniref:GOLD domain-containing protein n=1 Tax=Monopterus albus TaxID=43700 RepID=A0A3Q3Q338_MONAL